MSSVTSVNCSFTKTGTTIQGDVTFTVSFTETEARLNLGFAATVFVIPTVASTQGIVAYPVPFAGLVHLDTCRREQSFVAPTVYPAGQTQVTTTIKVSVTTPNLFNSPANVPLETKWTPSNAGLDVRVEVSPDISGSKGTAGDQRFPLTEPSTALEFNGVDNYIEANFSMFALTTRATVEFWMRGAPQESHAFFITNDARQRVLSAHVPYSDGNVYFDGGVDASGNYDRIVKQLSPVDDKSTWNHWAFVRDSADGRMEIYRNGALWHSQASGCVRPMTNGTRLVVGASHDGQWPHAGAFSEFRVWNTARSEAQIKDNMSRRVAAYTPGLLVSYALSSFQAGQGVGDASGNAHGGSMHGTPVKVAGPGALLC